MGTRWRAWVTLPYLEDGYGYEVELVAREPVPGDR